MEVGHGEWAAELVWMLWVNDKSLAAVENPANIP
jgi:hypothetical protein